MAIAFQWPDPQALNKRPSHRMDRVPLITPTSDLQPSTSNPPAFASSGAGLVLGVDFLCLIVLTMHQRQSSRKPIFLTRQPRCSGLVDSLKMKSRFSPPASMLGWPHPEPSPFEQYASPRDQLPLLNRTNPLSPLRLCICSPCLKCCLPNQNG